MIPRLVAYGAPILIAYGTTEGQTRKIAEFVGSVLAGTGHQAELLDAATKLAASVKPIYAAAILGSPVHHQRHDRALERFVQTNVEWLNTIPTVFFSVSVTAALIDAESRAEAELRLRAFLTETGLKPACTHCIAGALKHAHYDFFKRLAARTVVKKLGDATDRSSDCEYTNWADTRRFVLEFARDHLDTGRSRVA